MTTNVHTLTGQLDLTPVVRRFLALVLVLVIVVGAAWLSLTPTSVTELDGVIIQKWTELDQNGGPAQYWIEIKSGRRSRQCAIAGYQTQLVGEWHALQMGESAAMTCYGQSAVNLTRGK